MLWGSAFPAIKTGYKLFKIEAADTASIILFAGIRFFFAGMLTVIIFSLIERKPLIPKKSSIKKIGVLSMFQTILQYLFFYLGLAFTSGEKASVINASGVFFALLISALLFKMEKLNTAKLAGTAIGFAGVIAVSLGAFTSGSVPSIGDLFILLSSIAHGFSTVFMKRYSADENPAMLSGWQFMLGGAVMSMVGFAAGGHFESISPSGLSILLYLAFVSAGAYSLWSILLKHNDVSRVSVCGFMTPVFGYILSSVFTPSEKNSVAIMLLALVLVSVGIIIVNKSNKNELKNV